MKYSIPLQLYLQIQYKRGVAFPKNNPELATKKWSILKRAPAFKTFRQAAEYLVGDKAWEDGAVELWVDVEYRGRVQIGNRWVAPLDNLQRLAAEHLGFVCLVTVSGCQAILDGETTLEYLLEHYGCTRGVGL